MYIHIYIPRVCNLLVKFKTVERTSMGQQTTRLSRHLCMYICTLPFCYIDKAFARSVSDSTYFMFNITVRLSAT